MTQRRHGSPGALTGVDRKQLAEVSFQVPLNQDLEHLLDLLREPLDGRAPDVSLAALDASSATICIRVPNP